MPWIEIPLSDCGRVEKLNVFWPPTTLVTIEYWNYVRVFRSWFSAGSYYLLVNGFFKFDTSSLSGLTILEAILKIKPFQYQFSAYTYLQGEYYSWNRPLTAADCTPTGGNDSFRMVLDQGFPKYYYIPLSNLVNINKSGYTGFRLTLDTETPPTVNWNVLIDGVSPLATLHILVPSLTQLPFPPHFRKGV